MRQAITSRIQANNSEKQLQTRQRLHSLWLWRFDCGSGDLALRPESCVHGGVSHILRQPLNELLPSASYRVFLETLERFIHSDDKYGYCHVDVLVDAKPISLLFVFTGTVGVNQDNTAIEGMALGGNAPLALVHIPEVLLAGLAAATEGYCLFSPEGVMLWHNSGAAYQLGLTPRYMSLGVGSYSALRDKRLANTIDVPRTLAQVCRDKRSAVFTLRYGLSLTATVELRLRIIPLLGSQFSVESLLVQLAPVKAVDCLAQQKIAIPLDAKMAIYSPTGERLSGYLSDQNNLGDSTQKALQTVREHGIRSKTLTALQQTGPVSATAGSPLQLLALPLGDTGQQIAAVLHIASPMPVLGAQHVHPLDVRSLLDAVRAAICYLDRWGIIREVNRAAIDSIGGSNFADKSFIEYARGWDDAAERQREIMHVVRTGIAQVNSLESATIGDTVYWYSVDKLPTRDQRGQVDGVLLTFTNITQQVQQAQSLRDIEARYKAYRANSTDAVWCYEMTPPVPIGRDVDEQADNIAQHAVLVDCNDLLLSMLGVASREDILGSGLPAMDSKNYVFDIHTFIRNNYYLSDYDIVQHNSRGERVYRQISCVGVIDGGLLVRVWGTTKDITARKRYEEKLAYQANHDALTCLPNRVKLYREINTWLAQRRGDQQGALLLIDLDSFKEINDTLGHQVGDKLLQLIGPRLEAELTETPGIVARLGGDEFAIFVQHLRNAQQAIVVAHRVLDALREEFNLDGFSTEISASIGIALCPGQAADVSTMMRYADVAMYRAKKDMVGLSLYCADHDPHSPERLAMMGDLGRAIREDQLALVYQPKIDIQSQRFCGFEVLLRWLHPHLGFVSPAEFIPIVELTSLVHPMTAWVLETAIAQCCQWHKKGIEFAVAVNLSARNLLDDNLPVLIDRLLKQYHLPASALDLEITESSIMTDPNRAMRNLQQLHSLGVNLSIDDFGTGYSSLAYLKRLPVQVLKIDNTFVRSMLESERDEIIVRSTIQLAHNLGLQVVAEGVETEPLLERLASMGCDQAQGYYIARPLSAERAEQWLVNSPWYKSDA